MAGSEASPSAREETATVRLPVRVRIGLYTNQVRVGEGRNRAVVAAQRGARLRDMAHGGQTVLSAAMASLVADASSDGAWPADLGVRQLRNLARPGHVLELGHVGPGA
jgi:class 3 adenylate cyclase